ncbi:MAG: SDR family NAD(P)-dependent oxidoreductase [Gemmataceae bacterium]|nr:SDR family NAD(P)-dependent oxidoreductase [Gemmataceae bacterium]MDW8265364.1 SDR family NAD(P)-dependent oxidoreductase [Gemmataceae bacterium]
MSLAGRVAVVTGAAGGIGQALCRALARHGCALGLLDCNEAGLATLADTLASAQAPHAAEIVDVRRRTDVQRAIASMERKLGPVDILVACAGVTGVTLVRQLAVEETEHLLEVNVLGAAYAIEAVLPGMLARRQGQIVGVSSLAGCRGMPFSAGYSASKAALSVFLEGLRPPLRRKGIYVTIVLPGHVRTPLMDAAVVKPPMPPISPDEAAQHILRAIRRRSRVCAFPRRTCLGLAYLNCLPTRLFDWTMTIGARRTSDVEY